MADIFLAYSRRNSKKAASFKGAFSAEGISVFDDSTIPTGANWRKHIEKQLRECRLLVVLWSRSSVESDYVKEEADMAKDQKKLFPIMITKCELPYGFRSFQAKDMTRWRGDRGSRLWAEVIGGINAKLSRS